LLDVCALRVGTPGYAIGVTTLPASAVKRDRIEFVGKAGVRNVCSARVYGHISPRLQALLGVEPDERILRRTSAGKLNKYLQSVHPSLSCKALRTWAANTYYVRARLDGKAPKDALSDAARALHHTPSVCKRSYVLPSIYALSHDDIRAAARSCRTSRHFSSAECTLKRLLGLDRASRGRE